MHGDEGGLDEHPLDLLVEALIQGVAPGGLHAVHVDAHGLGGGHGLRIVGDGHEVHAQVFLDRLGHGHPTPAGCQVDLLPLPGDLIGAQDLLGGGGEEVLKQIHHVVEVGVGLIQLHGGELRVVLGVHALVAEDAADLIHPLQAADDEPLQMQLGGDAHVHVDVQRVVVGDEGAGGGTAGDGVQHGGLHLHVAPAIQEGPQVAHELAADLKVLADLRVHDEVHIAPAIAQLLVLQAVELLRQGVQGLGQQGHVLAAHAHLAPLGAEDLALHADDVADVILLKGIVLGLVHLVLPGVELDAAGLVLHVAEAHLAHAALGHQAAGDGHGLAFHLVKVLFDLLGVVGDGEFGLLEGVFAFLLKGGQLIPTDLEDLGQVLLLVLGGGLLVVLCHAAQLLFSLSLDL